MPPRSAKLAEDETDLRLFPPLRAGWPRRGEEAPVPISGGNAKRVLFGAINIETGHRLFDQRAPRPVDPAVLPELIGSQLSVIVRPRSVIALDLPRAG